MSAAVSIAALAAACKPQVIEKIVEKPGETVIMEVVTATPASTKAVELIYASWGYGKWDEFIQMFNTSQTAIHATFEQVPWDAYREKMLTEFAAGTGPDIAEVDGYWMYEFAHKGLLRPLDEYMATDPELAMDKWIEGAFQKNLQVFDGVIYGLPSGDSPKVIWFNPDIFAEVGVKTPLEWEAEGQWNWDNFLQTAVALTKGEGPTKRFGYGSELSRGDTHDVMRSFGGGWTNQDVTEIWCQKPESVQGLQFLFDVYLKYKAGPLWQELQGSGDPWREMFLGKRLAMFTSGVWQVYELKQSKEIKYDVAPLPMGPAGRFMYHSPNGMIIPVATKYPDEAWQVMRFLKSPGLERIMVQGEAFMPFQKASVETFLTKGYIPNAKLFIEALEKGWAPPLPMNENVAMMDQAIGESVGIGLSEGKDAKWVTDDAAPKLVPLLSK